MKNVRKGRWASPYWASSPLYFRHTSGHVQVTTPVHVRDIYGRCTGFSELVAEPWIQNRVSDNKKKEGPKKEKWCGTPGGGVRS